MFGARIELTNGISSGDTSNVRQSVAIDELNVKWQTMMYFRCDDAAEATTHTNMHTHDVYEVCDSRKVKRMDKRIQTNECIAYTVRQRT